MERKPINKRLELGVKGMLVDRSKAGRPKKTKVERTREKGLPSGMHAVAIKHVNEEFVAHAQEALDRLLYWMRTDDSKASPAAAVQILNRGLGMPKATTEISGPGGSPLLPPSLNINFVAMPAAPMIEGHMEDALDDKQDD